MKIESTSYFDKRLSKRLRKNPRLRKSVSKQLKLLQQDLRHPSLKLHRLKGKRFQEYAFWVEGNLRITFQIIKNPILLTDIVTHDEY